jgi:hypothetical protein
MKKLNIVGRQVGWTISRSGVSKIENGAVYIPDYRLPYFAQLFAVTIADLYPKSELRLRMHDRATQFDFD